MIHDGSPKLQGTPLVPTAGYSSVKVTSGTNKPTVVQATEKEVLAPYFVDAIKR
jgi:hypothetical protein